jgi:hypothetical protein
MTNARRHPTCSQNMHASFTPAAYHELDRLDPTQTVPTKPKLIVWKVHAAHDHEHGYHDSWHSIEVAQLYPQDGDSITRRWLRVSILPNIHFLGSMARRSPHSPSQHFPARKIFTLRFLCCGSRILQRPPLVPRLGDKPTPSPKSRKSHPIFLPRISAKLGKQHVT